MHRVLITFSCMCSLRLAKLGLLPTFFGQSINGVVKQKYHGDVTMVPKFTPMESIGLKVHFIKMYLRACQSL